MKTITFEECDFLKIIDLSMSNIFFKETTLLTKLYLIIALLLYVSFYYGNNLNTDHTEELNGNGNTDSLSSHNF